MNRKLIFYPLLFVLLCCFACERDIEKEPVIYDLTLSEHFAPANGTATINVTCRLHSKATNDRRQIRFALSSGQFVISKDTVQLQAAAFEEKMLIARTQFVVGSGEGVIRITAQPNVPDIAHDQYLLIDSVVLTKVNPEGLELSADAAAISANGGRILTLTGLLQGEGGGRASKGFKVLFEDQFEVGIPDTGEFISNSMPSSDNNSQVKTTYAIGAAPVGSRIRLIATLLDANGKKTNITDTITIYVNE